MTYIGRFTTRRGAYVRGKRHIVREASWEGRMFGKPSLCGVPLTGIEFRQDVHDDDESLCKTCLHIGGKLGRDQ